MKKLIILTTIIIAALQTYAQNIRLPEGVKLTDLPTVYLPDQVSVHFISPEPIQYVDISSKWIIGDLPVKNILRIRHKTDSAKKLSSLPENNDAVVTIVGEKYLAQYHVVYTPGQPGGATQTDIEILPADTRPLDNSNVGLSQPELKCYALSIFDQKPEKHLANSRAYGIKANLNHVYTLGDYIFLDVSYENHTNLKFNIDESRFNIEDQKVTKATNVQSVEIKPDFILFDTRAFKRHYRNIFVFKKFTYPGNKILHIELGEKQLSGRTITLSVPYKDLLEADVIPLE